jgi:hypothetical protein
MPSLKRCLFLLLPCLWLLAIAPVVSAATVALALPDFSDERTIIILLAASVLFLTVLAILIILLRRARPEQPGEADYEPKAYLKDLQGVTSQGSHELGRRAAMLGRVSGPENSQLDYIVIPESTVGRRHALIEYKDYSYWIIDQGSINGTYVNNRMVSSEARLKHGDRIKLHKYEFEFIVPELVDTGMTVVSDTVYKNVVGDNEDEEQTTGSRIILDEEDFDEPEYDDATAQMDSNPVRMDIPLSFPDADDGEDDATIAPGMEQDSEHENTTLQRFVDTGSHRSRNHDDDDEDDNSSRRG